LLKDVENYQPKSFTPPPIAKKPRPRRVNVLQFKENLGNSYQQYKAAANIIKTLGILIATLVGSTLGDKRMRENAFLWKR
jgi:hypothetical protein